METGKQIKLLYDFPSSRGGGTRQGVTISNPSGRGGFYSTSEDSPHVILRLKDGIDTWQPSANGVSVSNLFRLGEILQDDEFKGLAHETIQAFEVEMLQHPWLFPTLLSGVVTARLGGEQVVAKKPQHGHVEPGVAKFFTSPRAGLRSLVYVTDRGDSWVETRNPGGRKYLHE